MLRGIFVLVVIFWLTISDGDCWPINNSTITNSTKVDWSNPSPDEITSDTSKNIYSELNDVPWLSTKDSVISPIDQYMQHQTQAHENYEVLGTDQNVTDNYSAQSTNRSYSNPPQTTRQNDNKISNTSLVSANQSLKETEQSQTQPSQPGVAVNNQPSQPGVAVNNQPSQPGVAVNNQSKKETQQLQAQTPPPGVVADNQRQTGGNTTDKGYKVYLNSSFLKPEPGQSAFIGSSPISTVPSRSQPYINNSQLLPVAQPVPSYSNTTLGNNTSENLQYTNSTSYPPVNTNIPYKNTSYGKTPNIYTPITSVLPSKDRPYINTTSSLSPVTSNVLSVKPLYLKSADKPPLTSIVKPATNPVYTNNSGYPLVTNNLPVASSSNDYSIGNTPLANSSVPYGGSVNTNSNPLTNQQVNSNQQVSQPSDNSRFGSVLSPNGSPLGNSALPNAYPVLSPPPLNNTTFPITSNTQLPDVNQPLPPSNNNGLYIQPLLPTTKQQPQQQQQTTNKPTYNLASFPTGQQTSDIELGIQNKPTPPLASPYNISVGDSRSLYDESQPLLNATWSSPVPLYSSGNLTGEVNGNTISRDDIVPERNHGSFSKFEGSIGKIEFGTVGDKNKLNGSRSVTTLNDTREFDMGNRSYTLTNLTNFHNCSGCLKDENSGKSSLTSYEGNNAEHESSSNKLDVGTNKTAKEANNDKDKKKPKRCQTKPLSVGAMTDKEMDMFNHDDNTDDDCLKRTRRRLVTNKHTHSKTTHVDGTTSEKNADTKKVEKTKDDEKEEEKNKQRQELNEERKQSNEDRSKDLQKLKEKILSGAVQHHYNPEPTEPPNPSRDIENQTMIPDPSMIPNNESDIMPDKDHLDAGVGIVGIDLSPAIEETKHKTKKVDPSKVLTNGHLKVNASTTETTQSNNTLKNVTTVTKNETVKSNDGPKTKRILCFGDSLTNGFTGLNKTRHPYSKKLKELLEDEKNADYEVLTHGVNGECASKEMPDRLRDLIKEESPLDLVVILAGTNDLLSENCAKDLDLYESIKQLHEIAHSKNIKTVVATIPEVALTVNGTKTMTRDEFKEAWNEVNQKLRLYAATNKKPELVILCDLADELTRQGGKDGTSMKGVWEDNIHPSVEGYDKIGQILYKDVQGKI